MIGLQTGTGPRVQTTTWLHELASGHHRGSQCIPEVRPWARCQDVLVLPLVLERCWITFWKLLSNYWGWKECSGEKKIHKAVCLGANERQGPQVTAWFRQGNLHSQLPSASNLTLQQSWELIWMPGWNSSPESVHNVYSYHAFHFSWGLIWVYLSLFCLKIS